ncbi:MAG: hypothetical protein AAF297_01320 [Planctomycetota bacterium]
MMKSLSRLFGGKPGKKTDGADAAAGAKPTAPAPARAAKTPAPAAPKPKRPVEVLTPEGGAGGGGAGRTGEGSMFDTEAPLSTEPVRHRAGGTPSDTASPQHADDAIELNDLIDESKAEASATDSVAIRRLDDDDEDPGDTMQALSGRKSKQEMLNQLRKNYDEVLGIVRKVDQHLDEQAQRSERMLEIAERTAQHLEKLDKLGHLEELSERQRDTVEAVTNLVEITKAGNEDSAKNATQLMRAAADQLEQQREQTSTLRGVKTAVDRAGERDQEMADSIKGFTDTIGGVETATSELGTAITAMRENDAERERELAQIVARSQRWLIVTVVVVGVVAVGALATVVIAAF